jgi:hypothetical protein
MPACDLCDYEPEGDRQAQKLGLHRWSAHGIRKDGSNVSDEAPELAPGAPADDADVGSPFVPPPGTRGEVPPMGGGAGGSADAPAPRPRGLFSRLRKTKADGAPVPPKTREKVPGGKPPGKGKRISGAETLGDIVSGIGGILGNAGHVPTARVVAFQAPAAGELADELVKGTFIDVMALQPIVRSRGVLDKLFTLFAPTAITWRMEKAMAAGDQEEFHRMEQGLKWAIKKSLPTMLPAMRRVRDREAKENAALVEMLDLADLEMLGVFVDDKGQPVSRESGQVVDIGDIFVAMVFAEWVPQVVAPVSDPENEAQHAG